MLFFKSAWMQRPRAAEKKDFLFVASVASLPDLSAFVFLALDIPRRRCSLTINETYSHRRNRNLTQSPRASPHPNVLRPPSPATARTRGHSTDPRTWVQ